MNPSSHTSLFAAVVLCGLFALLTMGSAMYLSGLTALRPGRARLWAVVATLVALAAAVAALAHGFVVSYGLYLRMWLVISLASGLAVALGLVGVIGDVRGRMGHWPLLIGTAVGVGYFALTIWLEDPFFALFAVYEGAGLVASIVLYMLLAARGARPGIGPLLLAALLALVGCVLIVIGDITNPIEIGGLDHYGLYLLLHLIALPLALLGARASLTEAGRAHTLPLRRDEPLVR
jgi:hypothetical protein